MEIAIPSLSAEGFITDIRKMGDMVMAHYFASDFSQSNAFYGQITSLAYHVQQYGHQPERLRDEIETRVTQYLERYFDGATVTVTITDHEQGSPNRYNINFDAVVIKGDQRYSLGRLIEVQNGKVKNIINLFQTGTA